MGKMSTRRKLAIATWSRPTEGNIYGRLAVDVTETKRYLAWLRKKSGEKVGITHFVGKAIAEGVKEAPSLNGVIRFSRFKAHDSIDICYLVNMDGGNNLGRVKVTDVDQKDLVEIAQDLKGRAKRLREGDDEAFKKTQDPLGWMPMWLVRPVVWLTGFLTGVLGVSVPALGLEGYPFGTAIVTNVGGMGLDEAYAPPTPFAYCGVLVLVGAVRDRPAVVNGEFVSIPEMNLMVTIDHRLIDGAHLARANKRIKAIFANPWQLSGLDGPPENLD